MPPGSKKKPKYNTMFSISPSQRGFAGRPVGQDDEGEGAGQGANGRYIWVLVILEELELIRGQCHVASCSVHTESQDLHYYSY